MGADIDKENIKRRLEAVRQVLENTAHKLDPIMGRKPLEDVKEPIDIFSKGINWFFAISVGTLVWILSNFDKFKVGSAPSMPFKNLYVFSIICVGLSSILLAYVLGKLYWSNYMVTRAFAYYSINLNAYERQFEKHRLKADMVIKEVVDVIIEEVRPTQLPELNKSLDDFNAGSSELDKKYASMDTSLDVYSNHLVSLFRTLNNIGVLLGSLVAYILGLILISIYIILFMYKYL